MRYTDTSKFEGTHAVFGASNYHWINYSDEKFRTVYEAQAAKKKGTILHDFAAQCIKLNQKLPSNGKTLNMYVNDAIKYKMDPERLIFVDEFCYGTADAISFRNGFLRIHDLKTGITPANMTQLLVYAAFYCLENDLKPEKVKMELRIYQNDEVTILNPEPDSVRLIMEKAEHASFVWRQLSADKNLS